MQRGFVKRSPSSTKRFGGKTAGRKMKRKCRGIITETGGRKNLLTEYVDA